MKLFNYNNKHEVDLEFKPRKKSDNKKTSSTTINR